MVELDSAWIVTATEGNVGVGTLVGRPLLSNQASLLKGILTLSAFD